MATMEVSGLCHYRIQKAKETFEAGATATSDEDVIMWALDAAVEQGWMESDAHLLGLGQYFEPEDE